MTPNNDELSIESAQTEEEVPFSIGPTAAGPTTNNLEIEKLRQQDKNKDNDHRRKMQWAEFNSVFKLLAWCIFLAFVVYLLPIIFYGKDSFGSSFFELLKTIIVAVVGYLLGQKPKNGT